MVWLFCDVIGFFRVLEISKVVLRLVLVVDIFDFFIMCVVVVFSIFMNRVFFVKGFLMIVGFVVLMRFRYWFVINVR